MHKTQYKLKQSWRKIKGRITFIFWKYTRWFYKDYKEISPKCKRIQDLVEKKYKKIKQKEYEFEMKYNEKSYKEVMKRLSEK